MKRMIFIEPGRLEWEDVDKPSIQGPLEAIVRPTVMGRCDLDTLYLKGFMPLASGEPIGHEIIGEIIDLGEEAAKHFTINQTVIVAAQISCGTCSMCIAGETGRCISVPFGASYGMGREGSFGGAVSELVRVPFATGMMVPLPAKTDHTSLIGLSDMATDAWRAVGPQLKARPNGTVLVLGGLTPVIGIYAAGLAVSLGASRVVYADQNIEHRKTASLYGADAISELDELDHRTFDIIVDAASDKEKLLKAVQICSPAGYISSVAPPFQIPDLPMLEMYHKGLTYHIGRPNCRHAHEPVLEAWSCKGFKPEIAGPKSYDFNDAIEAWQDPALYVAVTRL